MPAEPPSLPLRWLYRALAVASLGLGVLGIFLPLLPTVPFVLLAAWFAARGSPELLAWMEAHPRFGPPLQDWRRAGVVRRRAKWSATLMMLASLGILLATLGARWPVAAAATVMGLVLAWLWRRPEQEQAA